MARYNRFMPDNTKPRLEDTAFEVIVAGLGNPVPEYQDTRHNAGADAVRLLAYEPELDARKLPDLFGCELWAGHTKNNKEEKTNVLLVATGGYINYAGEPLNKILTQSDNTTSQIIIVHGDINRSLGTAKAKPSQSAKRSSHNGLRSVCKHIPLADTLFVGVGIGRPELGMSVADYVMGVPEGQEMIEHRKGIEAASHLILSLLASE